jgi:GxxExxY protein
LIVEGVRREQLCAGDNTAEVAEDAKEQLFSASSAFFAVQPEVVEMDENRLSGQIIGAAIEVHRHLGPGLLESAYEECLAYELLQRSIPFERQRSVSVQYKDVRLDCGFRVDLLVSRLVVVELKAVDKLMPIHRAQVLTYLKLTGCKLGLLLNFNVPVMREGIKRLVLNL